MIHAYCTFWLIIAILVCNVAEVVCSTVLQHKRRICFLNENGKFSVVALQLYCAQEAISLSPPIGDIIPLVTNIHKFRL